jgi:hypothetical protein
MSVKINTETTTKINSVSLELSLEEALALQVVFQTIGGSPEKSLRGGIDRLNNALADAGISTYKSGLPKDLRDKSNYGFYFRELTTEERKTIASVLEQAVIERL